MNELNCWQRVVKFFNERYLSNQKIVTRKELMAYAKTNSKEWTLDTDRMYLTKAGWLLHIGRGKYKIIKLIPCGLGKNACRRIGYGY